MFRIIGLSLYILLLFTSCKKQVETLTPKDVYSISSNSTIRDILVVNDTLILAVGGIDGEKGNIYQSTNGEIWELVYSLTPSALYSIHKINENNIVVGGQDLTWIFTKNGGQKWLRHYWVSGIPIHGKDRGPIKQIEPLNDTTLVFCSGQFYNTGAAFKIYNMHKSWTFEQTAHELNDISVANGKIFIAGFGFLADYKPDSLIQNELVGHNFAGIHAFNKDHIVVVTNAGKVLETDNGGNNWSKTTKLKGKGATAIKGLLAAENNLIAYGANGQLFSSKDFGETWNTFSVGKEHQILNAKVYNSKLYLCLNSGKVLELAIDQVL